MTKNHRRKSAVRDLAAADGVPYMEARTRLATQPGPAPVPVVFTGYQDGRVTRTDQHGEAPLPHHVRHSPTGFAWGYAGSGPSELARCLLISTLGERAWCPVCTREPTDPEALCFCDSRCLVTPALYQALKFDVVAALPDQGWQLPVSAVTDWLQARAVRVDVRTRAGETLSLDVIPENDLVLGEGNIVQLVGASPPNGGEPKRWGVTEILAADSTGWTAWGISRAGRMVPIGVIEAPADDAGSPVDLANPRFAAVFESVAQVCKRELDDQRIGLRAGSMLRRVVADAVEVESHGGEQASLEAIRRRVLSIAESDFTGVSHPPGRDERLAWMEAAEYVAARLAGIGVRPLGGPGGLRVTLGEHGKGWVPPRPEKA